MPDCQAPSHACLVLIFQLNTSKMNHGLKHYVLSWNCQRSTKYRWSHFIREWRIPMNHGWFPHIPMKYQHFDDYISLFSSIYPITSPLISSHVSYEHPIEYLEISWNGGTPRSSSSIAFSMINQPAMGDPPWLWKPQNGNGSKPRKKRIFSADSHPMNPMNIP